MSFQVLGEDMLQASATVIFGFITAVLLFSTVSWLVWAKYDPSLDWLEGIFVTVVGTVICIGWLSTTLVSFGLFSLATVAILLFLGGILLFWWQRPLSPPKLARPQWPEWLLLFLLLGTAIVYFRPHEYVFGGIDPGGYVNIAATAVRTGDFILTDEWTGILAQHADVTLRPQPPQWRTDYLQFVGWYVDDSQPNRIIPQFFPFHAMLLAVGQAIGGLYAGLLVTPLWATLSLAALFLLGRRLFNPKVGLLAAVLLAVTPTHIYFSRYPTTEPLTLLLVFAGLLAWQTVWDKGGKATDKATCPWGILGGAAFGAAFLTRIDLPLVALLLVAFLLLYRWQGRWHRGWTITAVTLGLLAAQAGVSSLLLNWPYMWNTYGSVFRMLTSSSLVVAIGLVTAVSAVAFGMFMWRVPWRVFQNSRPGQWLKKPAIGWALAGLAILLSLFAYFVRPGLQPPTAYQTWLTGSEAFTLDGENWVRLGWYLTPLGLALSTLGLAYILGTHSLNRYGLFLAVGVATTVQYVYRIFNTAYHIYAMRRYVPIVLPMLVLFTAVALYGLLKQKQQRTAVAAGALLTIAMLGGLLYQSRFVLPLRDLRGATAALQEFHEQLDPNAMILISEPVSSMFSDTLGPPLRFIFGHDIATIRQDDHADAFFADMIAYAEAQERPLQLIAIAPVLESVRTYFDLEPIAFVPIRLPKLRSTFTDFPSEMQTVYYGIEIYNVEPKQRRAGADELAPLTVDIGSLDAAYLGDGFYGKEPLAGDITARWTDEEATLYLPIGATEQWQIEVQARIFRPDAAPETAVSVWLNETEVGQFTPTAQWETFIFYTQEIEATAVSELTFQTDTFNPAQLQINNDPRDLGFLIDWVRLTPVTASNNP